MHCGEYEEDVFITCARMGQPKKKSFMSDNWSTISTGGSRAKPRLSWGGRIVDRPSLEDKSGVTGIYGGVRGKSIFRCFGHACDKNLLRELPVFFTKMHVMDEKVTSSFLFWDFTKKIAFRKNYYFFKISKNILFSLFYYGNQKKIDFVNILGTWEK